MSDTSVAGMEDDGEDFADGDAPLSSQDPARLEALRSAMTEASAIEDEQAQGLAAVALLSELFGDDLEVR